MIKYFAAIVLLFLSVVITVHGQTKTSTTYVDYGYINENWVYKNQGFGVQYPFPKNWYFLNPTSKPPSYVRVGANQNYIYGYTVPIKIPIAQFIKLHDNSVATLFCISQLEQSSDIVKDTLDYKADKTFYIGITKANQLSEYDFLRKTCLKCTDETFKEIFMEKVKIGNTEFNGYITGTKDNHGNTLGHFFGIKRIKDFYLVLEYNFPDLPSFESYKTYLKEFSVK